MAEFTGLMSYKYQKSVLLLKTHRINSDKGSEWTYILFTNDNSNSSSALGHHLRNLTQSHCLIAPLDQIHAQLLNDFGVESSAAA